MSSDFRLWVKSRILQEAERRARDPDGDPPLTRKQWDRYEAARDADPETLATVIAQAGSIADVFPEEGTKK